MINILIVEDSPVIREFLHHILGSDPELNVIGVAHNGEEAVEAVRSKRPDVVTMDIHMPKLNGFDATRKIMEMNPVPIVIVSGSSTAEEIATTFHALESGALAVVRRPAGVAHPDHEAMAKELIQTVKLMSEVKVVRRWPQISRKLVTAGEPILGKQGGDIRLVAVGASTGGPLAIQTILSRLPRQFPVPIIVVQHMAQGFVHGFAEWLRHSSVLPVSVASHGEMLLPGHVYIAPDEHHTLVSKDRRIVLRKDEPESGLRPAVAVLFRSVAEAFGPQAIGILLTGMGKDGAEELGLMKERGATTLAQKPETCIVPGMPGEAVRRGSATFVFSPEKIAEALVTLVEKPSSGGG
ncbi:MAG: chemotaxis-specific protein-glutamate methyltransferase CheB [Ignavibacteriales bacterium]|nr:chemotaxis-specific protein-glutamate methyltransferase CheB [Ignavibacteriales bacterium]